jgi:hypothetical protein
MQATGQASTQSATPSQVLVTIVCATVFSSPLRCARQTETDLSGLSLRILNRFGLERERVSGGAGEQVSAVEAGFTNNLKTPAENLTKPAPVVEQRRWVEFTFKFPSAHLPTCSPTHLPTCTPAHLHTCPNSRKFLNLG